MSKWAKEELSGIQTFRKPQWKKSLALLKNWEDNAIETIESPILGGEGNREFLLHARFCRD